jgi:hypothetical protein
VAWMFICCQVEVSATSWSLVQRSPTECGASLCVIKKPRGRGGHSRRWAAKPEKQTFFIISCSVFLSLFRTKVVEEIKTHTLRSYFFRKFCLLWDLVTYLLIYLLTYSMERSPSWEADQSLQLVKKFPAVLWNPKVL